MDAIDQLDAPMIIYTADHGDMQNAHGLMAKGPAMYEEITHVPFLIKGGPFRNRRIQTPVSHIDILPDNHGVFRHEEAPDAGGTELVTSPLGSCAAMRWGSNPHARIQNGCFLSNEVRKTVFSF